jgi:hypothetical protein
VDDVVSRANGGGVVAREGLMGKRLVKGKVEVKRGRKRTKMEEEEEGVSCRVQCGR